MRYDGFPAAQFGNVCASGGFDGFTEPPPPMPSTSGYAAVSFRGQTFSLYAFTGDGCICRATSHGEVVTGQNHRPVINVGGAENEVGG